jgi:hypothetical protein
MNTKTLANHYAHLTPEERFRLVLAAGSRDDEAELDRLANASKRITFSTMDYSPFSHALHELAVLVLLELLEEVAKYDDAFAQWSDTEMTDFIDGKIGTPALPKKKDRTITERSLDLYRAQGFILRTKAAGWKLFCERMGFSPFGLWQYVPGLDRLQRALDIVEGTPDQPGYAFTPLGIVLWLNSIRPADRPEATESNIITAEGFADSLEATFQERVRWWGG